MGEGFFMACVIPLYLYFLFSFYPFCPPSQLVACQVWNTTGEHNPNLFASQSLWIQTRAVSHQLGLPMDPVAIAMGMDMGPTAMAKVLDMGPTAMVKGMDMGPTAMATGMDMDLIAMDTEMDIMGQLAECQIVTPVVVVADMAYLMRPKPPSFT